MSTTERADLPAAGADLNRVAATLQAIEHNVRSVMRGKDEVVRLALITLLAGGHLLVEDVPGVGKTLLARALARSVACRSSRIQFTPDLLPSDVTGVTVYSPAAGHFEFRAGPVFANIVLADEINRAGPKTQSALLEAMEERTVTIDGTTHEISTPFMVIATQNPIELDGTFPLPEAQRDRFLIRTAIGYPRADDELEILRTHGADDRLSELRPVADAAAVIEAAATIRRVHVAEPVERYLISLCRATRSHPDVELGVSPRAAIALLRASRVAAAVDGRGYVTPDDVKALAPHVLPHRLILRPDAELAGRDAHTVIDDVLAGVTAPVR